MHRNALISILNPKHTQRCNLGTASGSNPYNTFKSKLQ